MYIYIYIIYEAKCCIGRPVHRTPAVYVYVTVFPIMYN